MDQLRHQLMAGLRPARLFWGALALALAAGCDTAPAATVAQDTASRGEGGAPVRLDSALTLFRQGLEPVDSLEGGRRSIDALVDAFHSAVARRDTATLRAIAMTRAEFAYLYYPESPFTRPPMKQEPGLVWFLHMENSRKGATRLFDRLGDTDLRILRNECKGPPRTFGSNRLWDDCVQTISVRGDTSVIRLFAGVLERDGQYKIFSYSNDL